MSTGRVRSAYTRFLALGKVMAEDGHFEVAYHAFMAAVHCAEDVEDRIRLAEAADVLRRIKNQVDAISPPHKLSTRNSHAGRSIFEIGATSAEAAIKRLESHDFIERLRREK
jgi:hypothetical protein